MNCKNNLDLTYSWPSVKSYLTQYKQSKSGMRHAAQSYAISSKISLG